MSELRRPIPSHRCGFLSGLRPARELGPSHHTGSLQSGWRRIGSPNFATRDYAFGARPGLLPTTGLRIGPRVSCRPQLRAGSRPPQFGAGDLGAGTGRARRRIRGRRVPRLRDCGSRRGLHGVISRTGDRDSCRDAGRVHQTRAYTQTHTQPNCHAHTYPFGHFRFHRTDEYRPNPGHRDLTP